MVNNWIPPLGLGFLATTLQILLIREFSAHFYGNEISFGLVLGSWLLWGGLGSIVAGKIKYSRNRALHLFGMTVSFFLICLLCLRFSRFFLGTLPGEMTGATAILTFSLVLTFFVSLPLGILFVFNVHLYEENLPLVYLLESAGASAAGVVLYFAFIPNLSNWQTAALAGSMVFLLVFLSLGIRKGTWSLIPLVILFAGFFFLDVPLQRISWKPFHLIQSKDSRYGKLQVIRTADQISLYDNNVAVYSYPDPASSEESVHFALLQHPDAKKILLIGGGVGGGLRQALKYPGFHIDYVELDPDIIRISVPYLPAKEQAALNNERVKIHYQDGRSFLQRTKERYDIIILNLPEPSTAQLNRFYTLEFFLRAKRKLADGGVFSFRVPSAENYISKSLQNFLSSLFFTLKEAFPEVIIIPGDTNIFLASEHPLSLDWKRMATLIEALGLANTYVIPQTLFSRLSPLRINRLRQTVLSGQRTINRDLAPISYFFDSVLWSTQFGGIESKLFSRLAKIKTFWLLDFPLILFLFILFILGLKKNPVSYSLTPLAVMGFTTIVTEILLIIAYQAFNGYLYQRIALLIASFMIGLSCGAYFGMKRKKARFSQVILSQSGFILLLLPCYFAFRTQPPEILFFLFLFGIGFLGGALFIVSNRLFLRQRQNYGLGYGLDLLGSFAGAIAVSSVLVPLVGLLPLFKYLLLLNSFCLVFLIIGMKNMD